MVGFFFIDGGFDDIFFNCIFFILCFDCIFYNCYIVYNLENRMVNI